MPEPCHLPALQQCHAHPLACLATAKPPMMDTLACRARGMHAEQALMMSVQLA